MDHLQFRSRVYLGTNKKDSLMHAFIYALIFLISIWIIYCVITKRFSAFGNILLLLAAFALLIIEKTIKANEGYLNVNAFLTFNEKEMRIDYKTRKENKIVLTCAVNYYDIKNIVYSDRLKCMQIVGSISLSDDKGKRNADEWYLHIRDDVIDALTEMLKKKSDIEIADLDK